MSTLLIEPFGGLAGDMLLAGLLDLGDPTFTLADLRGLADRLVPGECRLELEEVRRGSLRASRLDVVTPESGTSPHRHLSDLLGLLDEAALSPATRARAARVLSRLAEAEARVHGIDASEVHFHEVGAVDTLVDVCGAAWALERLGVDRVVATTPYVGEGTVTAAHGRLPVPAPATLEILRGVPLTRGPGGERVTPTGAALLRELAGTIGERDVLAADAIGYGAGTRDPAEGPPNLLRVSLGPAAAPIGPRELLQLECNLDDVTGEEVAFLLDELLAAGALDVWSTSVVMKKGRPGVLVAALARPEDGRALEAVCFANSPTLGVRWTPYRRTECPRETLEVELHGETIRVKVRRRPEGGLGSSDLGPEYEDLAALARALGRPLAELDREARQAALAALEPSP